MTVQPNDRRAGPFTSGTSFPFDFKVFSKTDLLVVRTDSNGVDFDLVLDSDYTVALNADQDNDPGGTVSYALATGDTVTILGNLTFEQPTQITNAGGFYPRVIESALDRIVMLVQQVSESIGRALRLPISTPSGFNAELPAPRGSTLLGINETGTGFQAYPISSEVIDPATLPVFQGDSGAGGAKGVVPAPSAGDAAANKFLAASGGWMGLGLGTAAARDVGTAANNVVALDGSGKLPAVDGSLLTNIARRSARRQTVLFGPVDSNGLSSFGGSTGGTTVTAAGTLILTAANGCDANGPVDRVGAITNPSWTGLSTNGTMYLYLDINADGTCTPTSSTLAPIYQEGGAYSTTNNQFTFNVSEMVGKVGNGSSAAQVYRVCVGQVTVSGGVVTAIVWYALKGRYVSPFTATLPGASTSVSLTHNLGVNTFQPAQLIFECIAADNGFAVGSRLQAGSFATTNTTIVFPGTVWDALTMGFSTANGAGPWLAAPKAGGSPANLTNASWKYAMIIDRGW